MRCRSSVRGLFQSYAQTILVGVLLSLLASFGPIVSGDTMALAQSSSNLVECLRQMQLTGCPGGTQFGVLQYLPAMALSWKGIPSDNIVTILGLLNIVVYGLCLVHVIWTRHLSQTLKWVFLAMLLGGPAIAYSVMTFSEILVIVLIVELIISTKSAKVLTAALITALLVSTRETAITWVAPMIVALILVEKPLLGATYSKFRIGQVAGVCMGLLAAGLFNIFKFGTLKNPIHANSELFIFDLGTNLSSFLGLWFAPGGGLLPFWPAVVVVLLRFRAKMPKSEYMQERPNVSRNWISVGVIAQCLFLTFWYSPYGWAAWGPRLLMPAVFFAVLLVATSSENRMSLTNQRRRQIPGLGLLVNGLVVFSAAPSIGFLMNPGRALSWFNTDGTCPQPFIIQGDKSYFRKCLNHYAWKLDPSFLEVGVKNFVRPRGLVISILSGLTLLLAYECRKRKDAILVYPSQDSSEQIGGV